MLEDTAIFKPYCENDYDLGLTIAAEEEPEMPNEGPRETFVTSTLPVIYALSATTVVAYMLVIMLFITPRTYVSGGTVVLGTRGFAGTSNAESGIGVGGRPWMQKVAALTVAISLTIATANTFDIAAGQYSEGFMDSKKLQEEVLGGQELKIIMTVSDAFLWLAQAQTLIRLFPRHREKVIIKWTALALISLCLLFNILNDFYYHGSHKARHFVDAVPALSYLFQLALGLLYCAWVMYYAMTKKRYAFYRPRMRNMCLLALLSIVAILVPVVFFVVDISKPEIARWGDYVRWVGACAASVVVWEWVERIEALERDDKRDGVLGREVFDGDEMLEVTPSAVVTEKHSDRDNRGGRSSGNSFWPGAGGRHRNCNPDGRKRRRRTTSEGGPPEAPHVPSVPLPVPQWPARPSPVATPISRTNTASAESTIYAVRYHPIGEASETIPEHTSTRTHSRAPSRATNLSRRSSFDVDVEAQADGDDLPTSQSGDSPSSSMRKEETEPAPPPTATARLWTALGALAINPFARSRQRPPPEVSAHVAQRPPIGRSATNSKESFKVVQAKTWDLLGKVEDFATEKAEKFKKSKKKDVTPALPVTRIPAPRRAIEEYEDEIREELEQNRRRERSYTMDTAVSPRHQPHQQEVDVTDQRREREQRRPSLVQTHTEPLAYRGSLAFVPAVQEEWANQEHDAIGTSSSGGQTASAPTTSAGPSTGPTVAIPGGAFQTSWYRPLDANGVPQATSNDPGTLPEPASTATASQLPVTPGTEGLPVVRIPPPHLRGIPGESSALRTRPDPPAPIPTEGTAPKYPY